MAAVDYFLKIDGIQGESSDSKHKNEIELESWKWKQTNEGTHEGGGGGGAGKVEMEDFEFVMKVNKASPKLFLACATGDHIKDALLTCRKAGKEQQEYLKIKFSELLISGYHTNAGGKENLVPTDTISFNFAKIEFHYAPQKADGKLDAPVVHNYSLKENKGG
jgi:type VI secretion system secreted protein Hcp